MGSPMKQTYPQRASDALRGIQSGDRRGCRRSRRWDRRRRGDGQLSDLHFTPGAIGIERVVAAGAHLEAVAGLEAGDAAAMARGHAIGIGLGDEGAGADVGGEFEG